MLKLYSGDLLANREKLVSFLKNSIDINSDRRVRYIVKEPALRIKIQDMLASIGVTALVPNPISTRDLFLKGLDNKEILHPALTTLTMEKIITDLSSELEVFHSVNPSRTAKPILRFITELKKIGLSPNAFRDALKNDLNTPKNRDLYLLFHRFDEELEKKGCFLKEDIAWKRVKDLEFSNETIILDGYYSLEAIDKALIERLLSLENVSVYINFPYYQDANNSLASLEQDYLYLKRLASSEVVSKPRDIPAIYRFMPQTVEQEVSHTLKTIKQLYWDRLIENTDDVIVLSNDTRLYQPIFQRLCKKEALAYRRGSLPLSQTLIVGEVKLLINFLTRPLEKEELRAFLSGKYFDFTPYLGDISKITLSSLISRIKLTGRSNNWSRKLLRMANESEDCQIVYSALKSLQKNLTLGNSDEPLKAIEISTLFKSILMDLKIEQNLLIDAGDDFDQIIELRAFNEMITLLDNLVLASKDDYFQRENFIRAWFSNVLESQLNIVEDGLTVHDLNEAPHLRGKYLFILGLTEDKLPARVSESWIFNDKERESLAKITGSSCALFSSKKLEGLQDYLYYEGLRIVDNAVYLSSPKEIMGSYQQQSRYFDEINAFGKPLKIEDLNLTPFYTSKAEYLEYLVRDSDQLHLLPRSLQGKIEAYKGHPPTSYLYNELGYLKGANEDELTLSVSAFSEYADCPYRFFAHKCLGIFEEDELNEEVSSLEGGNLWHKVLEIVYKERKEQRISLIDLESRLDEIIQDVFNSSSASDFYKKVELEKFYQPVKDYLLTDFTRDNVTPTFLELHFGTGHKWPGVKVGPYTLKGVIDRVDLVKGKADLDNDEDMYGFIVIDYKRSQKKVKDVWEAKDFQLTAYIKALMQKGFKPVLGGSYVSLRGGEDRFWNKTAYKVTKTHPRGDLLEQEQWEQLIEKLLDEGNSLAEKLYSGYYPPNYQSQSCRFCQFHTLCRKVTRGGDLFDIDEFPAN